jgi:DNA-binding transcriptional ArsR family regulator
VVTRAAWLRQLQEHPDRPQGRQHRQLDVLVALADQLDAKTGKGNVSVLELAKITGVSERTVKRSLGWARGAGLLERTSRGHRLGDGKTSASEWQMVGRSEPQRVTAAPQGASSRPQSANPGKAAGKRRSAKRPGTGGTYTPPDAQEVLAHKSWCRDCGFELDPRLAAEGMIVHPGCYDPLDSQ